MLKVLKKKHNYLVNGMIQSIILADSVCFFSVFQTHCTFFSILDFSALTGWHQHKHKP